MVRAGAMNTPESIQRGLMREPSSMVYVARHAPYISFDFANNPIADSYAWFFTYSWFDKLWSWTSHGQFPPTRRELSHTLRKRLEDQEQEDDDGNIPSFPGTEDNIHLEQETLPQNCQVLTDKDDEEGNDVIHCDYVGEDYDQWVAELPQPFGSQRGCELA